MTERTEMGKRLEASMKQAVQFLKGDTEDARVTTVEIPTVDVKALRARLSMTQAEFAQRYGFSTSAVQNWEQGRRRPERAARLLLSLIRDETEVVERHVEQLRA